ncbi:ATP-dependent DNA helicase PIF1 [Biomphalaria glabrata]|nr:ATP-dependent DNA helicase PIF1 [Biomphalaria glabrata]
MPFLDNRTRRRNDRRRKATWRSLLLKREEEKKKDLVARRYRRIDIEFQNQEKSQNTTARKIRRSDPVLRDKERKNDTEARRCRRIDPEIWNQEQTENTLARKRRRTDPKFRQEEMKKDLEGRRCRRKDPEIRNQEQTENTLARKRRRTDPKFRQEEMKKDLEGRRCRRIDPEIRIQEQTENTLARKRRRTDPKVRDKERQKDSKARRCRRTDPKIRNQEQTENTLARKRRRLNHIMQKKEVKRGVNARKTCERIDESVERLKDSNSRRHSQNVYMEDMKTLLLHFEEEAGRGPTYICECCAGLFFRNQVVHIPRDTFLLHVNEARKRNKRPARDLCYVNMVYTQHLGEWFCRTCQRHLRNGRHPSLAHKADGLDVTVGCELPSVPKVLHGLTTLEERLISPRIFFAQVVTLGRIRPPGTGQFGIVKNIINVPLNVNDVCKVLPRNYTDTETVKILLKRRIAFRSAYCHQVVRVQRVVEALLYLNDNSSLWKSEGIEVSKEWMDIYNQGIQNKDFTLEPDGNMEEVYESEDANDNNTKLLVEEGHVVPGGEETCLVVPKRRDSIPFAPGENKQPIGLWMDENAEELEYPTVFCGQSYKPSAASYIMRCRSLLRCRDRRAAKKPTLIFTMFKKIIMKELNDSIKLKVRKVKPNGEPTNITAGMLLDESERTAIINQDNGFQFMRSIRCSPAYWSWRRLELMAMIRQFGQPTFFITFSAAEMEWYPLLWMLDYISLGCPDNYERPSPEEVKLWSKEKKNILIQKDGATCARYFFQREKALKKVLFSPAGPFKNCKVTEWYFRKEEQNRGSLHSHGVLWLQNTPSVEDLDSLIKFIDQIITTSAVPEMEEARNCIKYQIHRHTFTCKKGTDIECRFNYPQPPMAHTMVLDPLASNFPGIKKLQKKYRDIQEDVTCMWKENSFSETFESFLERHNLTEEKYILVIRSCLKRRTVVLKRKFDAVFINAYNELLLGTWKANMDIQYVLDEYACASYIASYINKSYRGMSQALIEADKEARSRKLPWTKRCRQIANTFLTKQEVSMQEAVCIILGLPFSSASTKCIFINTSRPDKRVYLAKSEEYLRTLDPDSGDAFAEGILNHYQNRPNCLEDICLSDFAAWYDVLYPRKKKHDRDCRDE